MHAASPDPEQFILLLDIFLVKHFVFPGKQLPLR
jgi:hypothetical protein